MKFPVLVVVRVLIVYTRLGMLSDMTRLEVSPKESYLRYKVSSHLLAYANDDSVLRKLLGLSNNSVSYFASLRKCFGELETNSALILHIG